MKKAKALTQLTKDSEPDLVVWTPEVEKAFKELKQAVLKAPSSALLDYGKSFVLY